MVHKVKTRQIFAANVERSNRALIVPTGLDGKVGATAGWTVAPAANTDYNNLPASQTGSTLVVPLAGLVKGDNIIGFSFLGSLLSAGGAVTFDAQLRKSTPAAAAVPTDALVGTAATQVAVTASVALNDANTTKTLPTPEVVDGTSNYYLLITGTTAAATSIALQAAKLYLTQK